MRRKSADTKRLEGNPGNRPVRDGLPRPVDRPTAPDWLGDYGRKVFERILSDVPDGIYSPNESEILATYCQACDTMRNAAFKLQIMGDVIVDRYGSTKLNPWFRVQQSAAATIAALGPKLGLDPISREKLYAPEPPATQSKFAGLTAITGGR